MKVSVIKYFFLAAGMSALVSFSADKGKKKETCRKAPGGNCY